MYPKSLYPGSLFPGSLFPGASTPTPTPTPPTPTPGPILLEDGSDLLLEDGVTPLVTEDAPTPTPTPTAGSGILLEDGTGILLEDGSDLLLEGTPAPQQTFRQALCAKLESIAELSSIFAAIYPGTLPMTHDFFRDGAALSYTITSMPRGHVLSGSDGTATATVQLSAWSYEESVSDAIALELFNAIDGVFNDTSWGNGTIVVMSCLHDDEEDLPEPPKDRSDDWIYQIASVYIIKHRIVLPTNT